MQLRFCASLHADNSGLIWFFLMQLRFCVSLHADNSGLIGFFLMQLRFCASPELTTPAFVFRVFDWKGDVGHPTAATNFVKTPEMISLTL
jgi:hypothetical protein